VVGPLPSPVGPALFRVNAILTAQETSFEEARPELLDQVRQARAQAVIEAEVEALRDLLAGGATLEDLAGQSEMELGEIVWTGEQEDGIAAYNGFRAAAQEATPDDFPEIEFLEDGSVFALRVDEIRPPEVPPLEEVRERARRLAGAAALRDALAGQAQHDIAALVGGESFAARGYAGAQTLADLTRGSPAEALPAPASDAIFAMETGEVRLVEGEDAVFLLRLDEVALPESDEQAGGLRQALESQAANSIAQDMLTAVARAIEAEVGITVNDAALDAVHSQMQ